MLSPADEPYPPYEGWRQLTGDCRGAVLLLLLAALLVGLLAGINPVLWLLFSASSRKWARRAWKSFPLVGFFSNTLRAGSGGAISRGADKRVLFSVLRRVMGSAGTSRGAGGGFRFSGLGGLRLVGTNSFTPALGGALNPSCWKWASRDWKTLMVLLLSRDAITGVDPFRSFPPASVAPTLVASLALLSVSIARFGGVSPSGSLVSGNAIVSENTPTAVGCLLLLFGIPRGSAYFAIPRAIWM